MTRQLSRWAAGSVWRRYCLTSSLVSRPLVSKLIMLLRQLGGVGVSVGTMVSTTTLVLVGVGGRDEPGAAVVVATGKSTGVAVGVGICWATAAGAVSGLW